MGWWRVTKECSVPSGGLLNAIPGEGHPENYYNGDGPADLIENCVAEIGRIRKVVGKIELKRFLLYFHNDLESIPNNVQEIVDKTWSEIESLYREAWQRPSYNEEKVALVDFIVDGL